MAKLIAFNFITLNGFFEGPNKDTSWHRHGEEENEYSIENLKAGGTLLFGRVTYELMAGYWSTKLALENNPEVAKGMNNSEKIVFSRTLKKADWNNSRIIKENIFDEIKKLKKTSSKDMAILGSGSIVSQFTEHGLIDEYQIMVDPVVLGDGTPIFKGVKQKIDLNLSSVRSFNSGVVLLTYTKR